MNAVPACLKTHDDGVILLLKVVPRSARNQIGEMLEDRLKIKIAAPPVDSAANIELIRFLAKQFSLRPSDVRLLRGSTSRSKDVLLRGLTLSTATVLLEPAIT